MSNASANSPTVLPLDTDKTAKLTDQLLSNNLKRQLKAVTELAGSGELGDLVLIDFLKGIDTNHPPVAAGKAYQLLANNESVTVQTFLAEALPRGVVTPSSDQDVARPRTPSMPF